MSTRYISKQFIAIAAATAVGTGSFIAAVPAASADVRPGTYTSTTLSAGSVLLAREGHVVGDELVLIGRYKIHPTDTGGYVDFFPGHRVYMNDDGHGGYEGAAFLGPLEIGTFTLTPQG